MEDQNQNTLGNFRDPQTLLDDDLEIFDRSQHDQQLSINEDFGQSSDGNNKDKDKEKEIEVEENNIEVDNEINSIDKDSDSGIKEVEEDNLKDLEISISFEKLELIKKIIKDTQDNLKRITHFLGDVDEDEAEEKYAADLELENIVNTEAQGGKVELFIKHESKAVKEDYKEEITIDGKRVVEGVFNGQNMIGGDGEEYPIPANYSSKSKLVEGDILKLTIDGRGLFLFKQIGPIKRVRVVGRLEQDEIDGNYRVRRGEKSWKILGAPVTYFRGDPGDEVVILIPKNAPSKWAAVENIIKRNRD